MRNAIVALILFVLIGAIFPSTAWADAGDRDGTDSNGGGITVGAVGSGGDCIFTESGFSTSSDVPSSCEGIITVYENSGYAEGGPTSGMCEYMPSGIYDCDTGVFEAYDYSAMAQDDESYLPGVVTASCNPGGTPYSSCDLNVYDGTIACGFFEWEIEAHTAFPGIVLDIEPYPVTLVRWPTYFRFSGAGTATSTGRIPWKGRGKPSAPRVGDQANITLTLTLRPYQRVMQLHMPRAGRYTGDGEACPPVENFLLPLQSNPSPPATVACWDVPSHPAVGGGPLAGTINGLDELPDDMPLFVGWARVPYEAVWSLRWDEWEVTRSWCEAGPNAAGEYNCKTDNSLSYNNGHKMEEYGWKTHRKGGIIDPALVTGLPANMLADLNGDGRPDAFWDYNVKIRRMDESFDVTNPVWRRSWEWGGVVYLAVREAQSQSVWMGGSDGP